MDDSDLRALEDFVVENDEMEKLEGLLGRFNIFEAIGAVRQELRHSDFLAYLLDPHQNHGLGDTFAKRFLQKTLHSGRSAPFTAIDLDTWDLGETEVLREWKDVDILLKNNPHKLVVAVENKIDADEHGDQLERYHATLEQEFPGWNHLGLYLTPDGRDPSEDFFTPIMYGLIADELRKLVKDRAPTLGHDVNILIVHYAEALERHIMSESEIAKLCERIYRKHKQAIDLIIEHLPDQQGMVREFLENLIKGEPEFALDDRAGRNVRFAPKDWDDLNLRVSDWTTTKRVLLFEFQNYGGSLRLKLIIGPGDRTIREVLFHMAQARGPLLHPTSRSLNTKWNEIYSRDFISAKLYARTMDEGFEAVVRDQWKEFLRTDFPKINDLVANEPGLQPR